MANYTTNYKLKKPLGTENFNIEDQNGNMDLIDAKLKEIDNNASDGSLIADGSIAKTKLSTSVQTELNKIGILSGQLEDIATFDRKTYAELKTLKTNNQLKEGKRYILTDYATKYQQPDTYTIKTMVVEELILTASSTNTFEPIVFSSKYPQDTIWYNFDNNVCEDNTTPRNGFITRRYDHISGNNCPQDWRTMLWARWKPDANQYYKNDVLTNYSVWTSGNAVMGIIYKAGNQLLVAKNTNIPTNATDDNIFEIVYNDITIGMLRNDKTKIYSNNNDKLELKKGELHERLTFGNNCTNNYIGEINITNVLHNNVFDGCNYNSFGNNCFNSSFGNGCTFNSFGNNCNYNSFGNNCISNSFGNSYYNNSFGNNCNYNSFGNGCNYNSFGNSCYNNSFGNNCFNSSFGNGCTFNSFGNGCTFNSFGNGCNYLFVKFLQSKNLTSLDIYNKQYTITIEKNTNQYVYSYLNSSNQLVYTVIP